MQLLFNSRNVGEVVTIYTLTFNNMYMKLWQNMIEVITKFSKHFLKNYKLDFVEILQEDLYYIKDLPLWKSKSSDARILRYKKNGCRWWSFTSHNYKLVLPESFQVCSYYHNTYTHVK